jgi:hypothetical protein
VVPLLLIKVDKVIDNLLRWDHVLHVNILHSRRLCLMCHPLKSEKAQIDYKFLISVTSVTVADATSRNFNGCCIKRRTHVDYVNQN